MEKTKRLLQDNLGFKKRSKLIIKNKAFGLAHILAIKRLKKIVKNSSPQNQIKLKDGKKILFNLIYGMYGRIIYWECGWAKALQMRGHDVKVLVCGKTFTMCTSEYTIKSVHDDKTCKHCVDFSGDFLKTVDLPFSYYHEYISDRETENIKNRVNKLPIDKCKSLVYKKVKVGELSINAAMRYFEGNLDPDNEAYELVLRSELINSIIAIDVAERIVKSEKPDVVVTRHLGYSSWGSFAEYCTAQGIRVCYPGDGYIANTVAFDFNICDKIDKFFRKYLMEIRKEKMLDKKEEEDLQLFLDNRFHGKEGDTSIYGFSTDDVKDQFNLDKYDKTFACFPNVAWDSSLLKAHKGFKDVYEWVSYTIELFKNTPNYQLIVKIHPSEAYVAKSMNTVSDYILDNFSPLTENIKIIPPDTKISPYSLFSFIDAGIVYNGTIGLEMTLHGIPVIIAGITHYGNKKFTYDVSTKEEYKKIISNELPRLTGEQIQLAKTYGYFYFIKSFILYDLVYKRNFFNQGWNISSFDELKEGKSKYLDIICNYISNNGIYQDW